jgi:hypothetical protein
VAPLRETEADAGSREEPADVSLEKAREKAHAPPLGPVLAARGLGAYPGYAELLASIARLASRGYRLHRIGKSVQGEPLFALHLGPEPRGALTRTTVVLSLVHPFEWIGAAAHFRLLDRLLAHDLGDRSVIAIPIVNPDGVRRVDQTLRAGRRRFIRHNVRGVDLNRNFDASWGKLGLVQRLLRGTFHPGSRPASEPEVEAIAHHLSACRVDRALSLHSFGGAVLYPSAASTRPIHDHDEHATWARRIAQAIDPKRPYRAVGCARWAKGITAGGLELDWFHQRHGAVSLLIECSRQTPGLSPSRLFHPFAWFNPKRLDRDAAAISGAVMPFVRGLDA